MCWTFLFFFILALHLCRFCVVIRFFHHSHNGQSPPTGRFWFSIFILCASFQPLFIRRKSVIYCASELDKLLKYKTSSSSYHTALHKSLQQEHVQEFFSLLLCISPVNQSVISAAMYTWRCWSRTRINYLTENCWIPDGKTLTSGNL